MAERSSWPVRRILENLLVAAAAAGAAWIGWGLWHDRQLPARFERIHLGMDSGSVEAILGRPDWQGECGRRIPSLPREGCARELGYASAFAPLRPTYYLVQLDGRGRVIEAEAIHSP